MRVPPVCPDTMYGPHSQSTNSHSMESYRDRKTTGGVMSYSLIAVAVVAAVVAPAVMLGVVLGVTGVNRLGVKPRGLSVDSRSIRVTRKAGSGRSRSASPT